jgi:RNA polymerase sigma factor (TIGR02999 family)
MDEPPGHAITELLSRGQAGEPGALDQLMPLVYAELHQMAARYLARERPGHTLQSTGLVHEAFLRLVDQRRVNWQNRKHFFGLSAQLMRRILVDHGRRSRRAKRGAGVSNVNLDDAGPVADPASHDPVDALSVDGALKELEAIDPRQARVVELRFFGGLSVVETAEVLDISEATVKREWAMARAWLYNRIAPEGGAAPGLPEE